MKNSHELPDFLRGPKQNQELDFIDIDKPAVLLYQAGDLGEGKELPFTGKNHIEAVGRLRDYLSSQGQDAGEDLYDFLNRVVPQGPDRYMQGFMTVRKNILDRLEARKHAERTNQLKDPAVRRDRLDSFDIRTSDLQDE